MSTRSSILIEIPKELIGSVKKYDPNMFVDKEQTWHFESDTDKAQEIKINKKYLGIYCHWDGYPNGVGASLVELCSDFEKSLNLILGGDCSSITETSIRRYATRKNESWLSVCPRQFDKIQTVTDDAEYLYIFKDNRWFLLEEGLFIPLFSDIENYDDYVRGYLDGHEVGESFSQTLRQLDLDKLENE